MGTCCGSEGRVCVPDADVSSLSDRELDERLVALGRERSQVEGLLVVAAAEKRRRVGGRAAAAVMREQLRVSARQASAEVDLAASLAEEFPATVAALQAGEITLGHARVISRVGADAEHENEPALLEMARGVPVDLFARMTRHHYRPEQETLREHRRQHDNRWASLVQDPDGSWRLTAYFGYDTGKRVSLAFESMVRTYRNGEDRTGALTARRRRADALANLITAEGPHRRGSVTLMVIADYDAVRRELRDFRFDDSLPVPPQQLAELAARAKILPAFFDTDGDPLWLGRAQRHASAGQRAVLAARDGGCANCAAPVERCEPHHIEWFSAGGNTDVDNLCLLCGRCHHLVHDDGWQLHDLDGGLRLRPPPQSEPHDHKPVRAARHRNPILRT